MKVYVSHSTQGDYEKELYAPLRQSHYRDSFIFPHEKPGAATNSKELIRDCDVLVAVLSQASVGVGIELGWADAFGKPIICVLSGGYKSEWASKLSAHAITASNTPELVQGIERALTQLVVHGQVKA